MHTIFQEMLILKGELILRRRQLLSDCLDQLSTSALLATQQKLARLLSEASTRPDNGAISDAPGPLLLIGGCLPFFSLLPP